MRLRTRPALVLLLAAVFCATVAAATTFLTVSPTNLQGWQIQVTTAATATPTPSVTFVNGPGTPPLGTGSAEFRVGANGNDAAQLRHPGYAGTRLPNPTPTPPAANELSSLSYSTYVQQDGSGGQAPYIILQIDTDGDAGIEDLLFFEPFYQSATFCPSNPQPALVTGQWQTWDAFNGCWYSVFGTAGSGPGTNTVSLRTLSAALPTGVIANSSPSGLGGVRLVTGFGAGAWDNFVGNADAFRIGVGANDTLYNFDPNQTTAAAGALLITELRFRGPGGSLDEFVEIYNNSDSAHVVTPPDGSSGYALAGSDGTTLAVIPFGTIIPARAHFLFANSGGYSLSAYPAGNGTTATPDLAFTANIPDGPGGVALFSTSNAANFNAGTRLDAAGEAGAPALYREGAGLAPSAGVGADVEHSYVRLMPLPTGRPQDTDVNASDFTLVSTTGATLGGAQSTLGAPGPENTSSPVERNAQFTVFTLDSTQARTASPNRERDLTSDPANNSSFGTMTLRHRLVNNTGGSVTRLRFRVIVITGFPVPDPSWADLRVRSSSDTSVSNVGDAATCAASGAGAPLCTVTVRGTSLETPPAQPEGGGLNSSLSVGTVSLGTPLADGESVNIQFLLGIEKTGRFRFYVNVEAVVDETPAAPAAPAGAPARSPKRSRKLFMEAQSPTPRQAAAPQPRQPAARRWLYVARPVWVAPDAKAESEGSPAAKKKKNARTRKAGDASEQEAP